MGTQETVIPEESIANFDAVMDVVVSSKTALLAAAEKQGKTIVPGTLMTTYQGAKQFEIYTENKLPEKFIKEFLEKLWKKKINWLFLI